MLLYCCLIAQTVVFSKPAQRQNQLTELFLRADGEREESLGCPCKARGHQKDQAPLEASAAPQESPAPVPAHSLCSPQKGCTAAWEGPASFTQETLRGQLSPVIYSSDILACFPSSPLRTQTTNNTGGEDQFKSQRT